MDILLTKEGSKGDRVHSNAEAFSLTPYKISTVNLILKEHCLCEESVYAVLGRNFISACFKEYPWPLNVDHVTFCALPPPWYKPLRFEQWQLLYHQAPILTTAQFPLLFRSLSRSLVVNIIFLKNKKK